MTFPRFPFALLPLGLLLVLAGCGQAATGSPAGATGTKTAAPLPTQPPVPTATISGGSVAAVVNGHKVPMSTYRLLFTVAEKQSAGQSGTNVSLLASQTMNQVIAFELVREYAAAHHISVSPAEIDARVKQDEARSGGAKTLQEQLARVGLTVASYKALLAPSLLGQKVAQQVAPLSKAPQPVAHVRHILIMTHPQGKPARSEAAAHALASRLLKQIKHGADFASLARKYSDDTGSARQGGDLGNVYPHQTVPQFDHAAFSLKLNQPALIHTVYGYHIVEVLSRGKAPLPAQSQQQAQQQEFSTWLNKQMKQAHIKRIAHVSAG